MALYRLYSQDACMLMMHSVLSDKADGYHAATTAIIIRMSKQRAHRIGTASWTEHLIHLSIS